MPITYVPEPFRIKMVETIRLLTREERTRKIREAHHNVFNLRAEDVYIDLLTDSGTSAMSAEQWSGVMRGDEAYAGARSYFRLLDTGRALFGYEYVQPVHQGRAAEKVLFPLLMGPGQVAISNMFFDTTRAHVELAGARALDCVVPEARDTRAQVPFKGNMDTAQLERLIAEHAGQVAAVVMTITNNSAGGQPVSLRNMRDTAEICRRHGLPLVIDAARFAENAYFIQQREAEYRDWSVRDIVREFFRYGDAFTMSAKKDALVNMGGLIGVKSDPALVQRVKGNTIAFEGFTSYGGLSGRDLEALATGLEEGLDETYLRYRTGQVAYLASILDEHGIPYQSPPGGHGLFIDAQAMLPHIPYTQFPGQALAVELYVEAGIRTCDIGSFMLGNNPDTGEQLRADFEFTRLAVPRRVYTQAHFDVMAGALIAIQARAAQVPGYRITWEPPVLRHFQAELEPVGVPHAAPLPG